MILIKMKEIKVIKIIVTTQVGKKKDKVTKKFINLHDERKDNIRRINS